MIRQTINCDICAAEKQATSYWFVAYETAGEITLRGWESPSKSRKNAKHLCGQKCVQRLMSTFTASVMTVGHGLESAREPVAQPYDQALTNPVVAMSPAAQAQMQALERRERAERDEAPEPRVHIDQDLVAAVEAESWAGPVRPKESLWDAPHKIKIERESFLHASRTKTSGNGSGNSRLQKMA